MTSLAFPGIGAEAKPKKPRRITVTKKMLALQAYIIRNPGTYRKELCRGAYNPKTAEALCDRCVRAGLIDATKARSGKVRLWPKVGSEAVAAVEIGLDMLFRGLLAMASWAVCESSATKTSHAR